MRTFLLTVLVLSSVGLLAQPPQLPLTSPLAWPGTTSYDAAIPTPQQVLGYTIGERHTLPSQVVRYFEAVAEASDRVTVRQHGLSYEGRPLIHAIVTQPKDQNRLDELALRQQRAIVNFNSSQEALARPTIPGSDNTTPIDARAMEATNLADMPAVAYMGYSIHGNEASGTEAAILTLYHLAAGQGPAVDSVLNNVVTIIDPLFNPDGRDRFTDWVNRNRGAVATTDPQDREHNEPWPSGRTNHYWFDLNRDWLPAQHPESQARLEMFYAWRPQVLTDYHEMGSEATYFFQPGIPSRTNPFTPARNQELTGLITDYSARALDRIGSLYYTRESFDDFYYGKGSTYPDVTGSIGILFEQASSRALDREIPGGTINYGFSIRNQLAASLATLQATAALKDEMLQHSRDFYAGSSAYAKTLPTKAYLLPLRGQAARALELAQLLQTHRIQVYPVTGQVSAEGTTYGAGEALVIPTDQPQARLMQAILEPTTRFEDSLFYDVSTWTLPLAFDVEWMPLGVLPKGQYDPNPQAFANLHSELKPQQGNIIGNLATAYAAVIPYDSYYAPRAAYRITSAGGHARLLNEPSASVIQGKRVDLPRGSIVVPLAQNPIGETRVRELIREIVEQDQVTVYAATTGLTPTGPDFGGRSTQLLRQPKIALLTGEGTSAYQAGEAWHLLAERLHIPVSLIDIDRIGQIDLTRYTHIAMTGGRYNSLDTEALQQWVRDGGTLLASHTAAPFVVDKQLVSLEEDKLDVDSLLVARDLPYAQVDEARGAHYIGGAILQVKLDVTHPLAYGIDEDLPMFRQHTRFFLPSKQPGSNVGLYADSPLLSGYLSSERLAQAANKAAIVEQQVGQGRVILIFDNPNFRAFWRGSERVWLNALMLR